MQTNIIDIHGYNQAGPSDTGPYHDPRDHDEPPPLPRQPVTRETVRAAMLTLPDYLNNPSRSLFCLVSGIHDALGRDIDDWKQDMDKIADHVRAIRAEL